MLSAKSFFLTFCAAGILTAQGVPTLAQRIAARLRPNDLKADVSFLASDALQGRATPSPGLDMAAEYIASQFRRAGLEPAGDDGYFQTANYVSVKPNLDGLHFSLGGVKAADGAITFQQAVATELRDATAFKIALADTSELYSLTADKIRGKVLLVEMPPAGGRGGGAVFQSQRRLMTVVSAFEPAMLVVVRPTAPPANPNMTSPLRDVALPEPRMPVIAIGDKAIAEALAAAKPGPLDVTVSAHIGAPVLQPVKVRNVAGLLRGSDLQLKDTCLIVTGHYDHLGVRPNASGDSIYNGANDDASGTSSVIEIANAITA
ncbi:MAG: peptidase, partial [Candidatus Solibacter sp.]|nr:peptidase [Candidatus Solibacter sp.]